jgi:hypothetical protein
MDTGCDPRDRCGQGEQADALHSLAGDAGPAYCRIYTLTEAAMENAHRALPFLLRICAAIDRLFIMEVGPFGTQLAQDARSHRHRRNSA